jgi:ribosomal protein S18 acetylase RimI-like enzyme
MVSIRKGTPADSASVAAIHLEQIPWGLLTSMGPRFVDAFYRTLLSSPVGFVFVAEDDDGPVGFASGVVHWRRFYQAFLFGNWRLAAAVILRRVFDLRRWRRLAETSRYAAATSLPGSELLSIAVRPRARGTGTADALVRQVLDEFSHLGVTQVRVTTALSNEAAARVYERTGFRLLGDTQIHPGETARVYVITLHADGRTSLPHGVA